MTGGRRLRRVLIGALVIADIGLVLLASSRLFARLDMSRNHRFTLSETSRQMLSALPEPLSIEYWVSGLLASRYPFPSQIQDLLGEYAAWSRGKVTLRVVDPDSTRIAPESEGVAGRQMQMIDRDQVNLATVYSGIVLKYLDRRAVLPFVADPAALEYDVSSRIRMLETNRIRTLGVLVGDSRRRFDRDFRALGNELSLEFRIRELPRGAEVPPDTTVLFVLGNRDLGDSDLLPVDQFIMRGGGVLFAVDSVDIDVTGGISAENTRGTAVQQALAQYGLRLLDGMVLDVSNQRIPFAGPQGNLVSVRYPPWVAATGRSVDPANLITANFSGLDLYWPSAVEPVRRDGVRADILVRSSPGSWMVKDSYPINPARAASLEPAPGQERQARALAISLSGSFRSAFAGRAPLPAQTRDARIVVVSNVEFATDMIQFTHAAYNMTFLSNCAEWLAQEDDLLKVKTRSQGSTRLDAITDPGDRARAMRSSVVVNLVIVPLLVVAAGMIRLLRRRKRKLR